MGSEKFFTALNEERRRSSNWKRKNRTHGTKREKKRAEQISISLGKKKGEKIVAKDPPPPGRKEKNNKAAKRRQGQDLVRKKKTD